MTQHLMQDVVLCADDYALNAPVSQGIVALTMLGRLSATSVMSLSARWAEDAPALREVRQRLDVGLHLDWTSPFAVAAGHGSGLTRVMLRAALRLYAQKNIEAEIERQLDAFEVHWQAAPDHIDGHQHIQQFPVLRDALSEVLMRRYGAHQPRPWLRISQVAQPGLKARIISVMGAQALHHWAQQHAWPTVSPLLGTYGFDGGLDDYARHMQNWLADLPPCSLAHPAALIMCHPAVSAQADDAIGAARKREFAYLASHDFVQHMRNAKARLVRGSGKPIEI
ncbi:ChbG/HpnK family deacetylase [Limnohabitans sp.]|uniref:ChbG/HpnK family deacetylase n=1 Tax=Limnohabitans sp. TaxID=1907725 RepID=UPI00286EE5B6|nr:ChbG/HpnK family deacetylase [Limnohabitans sp.]